MDARTRNARSHGRAAASVLGEVDARRKLETLGSVEADLTVHIDARVAHRVEHRERHAHLVSDARRGRNPDDELRGRRRHHLDTR